MWFVAPGASGGLFPADVSTNIERVPVSAVAGTAALPGSVVALGFQAKAAGGGPFPPSCGGNRGGIRLASDAARPAS